MAVDKNFVVKNGLEVNSDLIVTDSSDSQNKKVGIGSTGPRTTLDVRGGIAATDGNFTGILTAASADIASFGLVNGTGANITGFSTLGGVSANQLDVTGVGTFTDISYDEATGRNLNLTGIATIPVVVGLTSFTDGITISGVLTATHISGGGFGVGIKTSGSVIGYGFTMLNFVGSGNTFAVNGTTVDISIAGGGGGSASIGVGSTPGDAFTGIITDGNLWYNTGLGRLFIYYQDDDTSQWVDAAPFNVGIITTLTNVSFDAGTVAAPAISFGSDTDSGFFSPSDGSVTVSSNGVGIVTFNSTGVLATTYFGDGSQLTGISADSTSLKDDDGNIKVQANPNGAEVTGVLTATSFSGDGSELTGVGSTDNIQTATAAKFLSDVSITGVTTVGVVTGGTSVSASHFYGDGSALTGIDATSIKDSGGNVKAQANPGGIEITGVATASSFVGDLTGSVTGAATQITVADESSDQSCNVVFTTAATGDQAPKTGTNLTFNSNSGQLSATSFSGNLTGSSNIDISGTLDVDDTATFGTDADDVQVFGTTKILRMGGSSGFQIQEAGTSASITQGTGALNFYYDSGNQYKWAIFNNAGSVDLYHANNKKFETTAHGAVVTGVVTATSFSGDGSQLTGTGVGTESNINTSGIITATKFVGSGTSLTFAPKIIAFDPLALQQNVAVGSSIHITFDQNIHFVGSGDVVIREGSSDGTAIQTFSISSGSKPSGLSIVDTQLIIEPSSNFNLGTSIYVTLPSTGIANTEGDPFAGSSNYNFRTVEETFSAQGGDTVYTLSDSNSPTGYYRYHIFTSSGILTTTSASQNSPDFSLMLVAGGGGGGTMYPSPNSDDAGGGGGAGGLISHTGPTLSLATGTYTITIGSGGAPTSGSPNPYGGKIGNNSTIAPPTAPTSYDLQAFGGGAGGAPSNPTDHPQNGGSGGGGRSFATNNTIYPGGNGTPGQGFAGSPGVPSGSQPPTISSSPNRASSGGGGGAGAAAPTTIPNRFYGPTGEFVIGGVGGPGSPITAFKSDNLSGYTPTIPPGTLTKIGPTGHYAGGGGGAGPEWGGTGGAGGGGTGNGPGTMPTYYIPLVPSPFYNNPPTGTRDGSASTGGGGGGSKSSSLGGNGGSGVMMIRYAAPAPS